MSIQDLKKKCFKKNEQKNCQKFLAEFKPSVLSKHNEERVEKLRTTTDQLKKKKSNEQVAGETRRGLKQ